MERASLSIGQRLKQARLDQGWTQEFVAGQIFVDPVTYRHWERGLHKPHPIHRQKLCTLFRKTKQELGLADDEPETLTEKQASGTVSVATEANGEKSSPALQEEWACLTTPVSPEVQDASTAFRATDLSECLESLVWSWLVRKTTNARYHELQTAITLELKRKDNSKMNENILSRRDALRRLASLPIRVCSLSILGPVFIRPLEEILVHCAAGIAACYHLRKGKDLAFAFDTVSWYLPTLKEIVKTGSSERLRREAADLLAQCLSLQSTLAKHVTTISDGLRYSLEATRYAEASANPTLHIKTLISHTSNFSYANQRTQALHFAEQAEHVMDTALEEDETSIPLLAQSLVYAHLASCQAHEGQHQEALISSGKAHKAFSALSIDEPVPAYLSHDEANLILQDGIAYHQLGMTDEAFDAFGQIIKLPSRSEEIGIEALIHQALVEASREDKEPDLERCILLWTQGIEGAKALGSQQRFNEAIMAYATMCGTWRKEKLVKDLRELTVWPEQHNKHN